MEKLKRNPFVRYLSLLAKKWVLWVCLVIDVIAYILGMAAPTVSIPQIVYWAIAAVGVLVAGYQVHSETESKLPKNHNSPLKINFALVEGNEYSVSLSEPRMSEPTTPSVKFEFNLRIENLSTFPVNVVLITGGLILNKDTLHLDKWGQLEPLSKTGEIVKYPLCMDAKSIYYCTLRGEALVVSRSDAIFAMQLRQFRTTPKQKISIGVYIADTDNVQHKFIESFEFSVRPVYEAYLEYWRSLNRNDLVSLALSEANLVS
jgi:hypothetical protein